MKLFKIPLFVVGMSLLCLLQSFENPPVRYVVDASKSKVVWTGYYLFNFAEHYGTVDVRQGELQVNNAQITGGYFEINMATIKDLDMKDDGAEDLSNHLRDKDFFGADQYPVSKFEITGTKKIEAAQSGMPNYEIVGFLTIKDVRKELTFPAMISFSTSELRAQAKFKFDRTKWGIHYNSGKTFSDVGDGAISDAIAMNIDLKAQLK